MTRNVEASRPPMDGPIVRVRERVSRPLAATVAAVALALGALLAAYQPKGGDPDLLYRPIKSELVRALRSGTLPFWSDRFGLGVPLVAESHAAAFYPPNWPIYGLLDVRAGYRFTMWLHYVALAAATYGYGRSLGLGSCGASLAALSFTLSGFQTGHATHEPFYTLLPYLPLSLMLAERYMAVGNPARLAGLALATGAQLTVGHFQIQMWTCGLVVLTGLVRARQGVGPWRRAALLPLAVCWGAAVAAPQLGLTSEMTRASNFDRPLKYLCNYAFPPEQWAQPALPRLFGHFEAGSLSPYWGNRATTPEETTFYVGTVTLILAVAGALRPLDRPLTLWKWLAPAAFALATMPFWLPEGYMLLLRLPGFGYFRAPGRYTLITTLGLCLLAGRGFDLAVPARRFWPGFALAALLGATAGAWGVFWSSQPEPLAALGGAGPRAQFLAEAALAWTVALTAVAAWRVMRWTWLPWSVVLVELTLLYFNGPTDWGAAVRFPEDSPVFQALLKEPNVGLVAGNLQDLPVRAGLITAYPNLGIVAPPPTYLLESSQFPDKYNLIYRNWLQRFGVSHGVFVGDEMFRPGNVLYYGPDPALDAVLTRKSGDPAQRAWRLERYAPAYPVAHAARTVKVVDDWSWLYPALNDRENADEVWFMKPDLPADLPGPRARSARVTEWSGNAGAVDHDGTVDLVLRRAYYPGWTARLPDGRTLPVHPADGGLQSVRLPGHGPTRVEMVFRPARLVPLLCVSGIAIGAAGVVLTLARRAKT